MSDVGTTPFGKYELLDRLGTGGMAIVYRARYTAAPGITKPVVIKRVLGHFAEDPAFVEMFVHEARISVGLNHGNIVQVFDFGQVNGEYFLAMELVDGQPLSRVLKKAQGMGLMQLPPPLAVNIAIEMCKGLHHAHTRTDETGRPLGLVHRDVSPDNVLISYEGEVKISDFGIAKAQVVGRPQTEAGLVKGKYLYLSPEQARGLEVDARSDVFAVAVVLYRMLCGRLPAEGNELSVLQRIVMGQLTPPLELNPDLDGGLVQILQDAMAVDRDVRTPSAEALHQQLSHWVATRAPLFPVHTLKHVMGMLYEGDLKALGRPPQFPPKFQEQVALWLSSQRPVPPSDGQGLPLPGTPPSGPEQRDQKGARSGPQGTMAAPQSIRVAPTPKATPPPAKSAAQVTRAAPPSVKPAPPEEERPQDATDEMSAATEQVTAVADATTRLRRVVRSGRVRLKEPEAPDRREAEGTRHFWLWMAGAVCLTALGVKLAVSYLLNIPPLELRSEPPGALVRVDGVVHGVTPLTLRDVSPREPHTVEMSMPGMRPWTQRFEPGQLEEQLKVKLEPAPQARPVQPAQQKPSGATPAPEDSFAARFGTDRTPAQFTLQEKWHSFSTMTRAHREPLEPRRSYTVWLSGTYTGDAPISEQDRRQGRSPELLRSSQVYAFVEGESVKADERLFVLSARPRGLESGKALNVFVLVENTSERNVGALTLHVRDNISKRVERRKLDPKRSAHQVAVENRYSVRQLDPDVPYTLDIRPREGSPVSALAVIAVPRAGERVQISGQAGGELRHVLRPGRYTVKGARELFFSLPRWEGDGEVQLDVYLGKGDPPSSEPAQSQVPAGEL